MTEIEDAMWRFVPGPWVRRTLLLLAWLQSPPAVAEAAWRAASEAAPAPAAPEDEAEGAQEDATEEAPPEDAGYTLEEVEIRGRREAPPGPSTLPAELEPTGFGTQISAEDFAGERFDTADLLLQAPGAVLRRTPAGSTLSLRGASPDQAQVFLDGIRLSPASGGGVDLRTIPGGLIDSVTVLRGNEGALYGAGALGGVAWIRTREAAAGETSSRLRLSGGSFGSLAFDGSVASGGSRFQGLAALSLQQSEGDYPALYDPTPTGKSEAPRVERMRNNDERMAALLLKGAVRLGGLRLHALGQGSLGERGIPGTLYLRDTQRQQEDRLLAAIRAESATPGDVSLSAGLDYRRDAHVVWGSKVPSTISQPAVPGVERPRQVEQALEGKGAVAWEAASWSLLRLDASAGSEWLESPYHGEVERLRFAVGVVEELWLGSHLLLAPALRYDRVGDFDGISPKLGASLRPTGWLELRANAGRSFRAPSLGELYLELGPVRANPALRSERGATVDGGLILRSKGLLVQTSVFYSHVSDLISYEIVSGGASKPFNFMDAEIYGGELEVLVRPLPWLSLSALYGHARTRNLTLDRRFYGKELPHRPKERVQARAALHLEDWEGFLEGSHQSPQYVNRSNTDALPAQTSVRLGGGRRLLRAPWELWLSGQVDNVFDSLLVDQLGFPGPGRAYFLTLRASTASET